jgi:hypothetical protein
MCYVCEDTGTVGPRYKAGLKAINAALRVWRRKKCGPECSSGFASWRSQCDDGRPLIDGTKGEGMDSP